MDDAHAPISTQHVVLMMDHGQFSLRGADPDPAELDLLEHALAAPPTAADGTTVVVLSPHQNNFQMPISVEVLSTRPKADHHRDGPWEQVSENRLTIDSRGMLQIDSTPGECIDCPVPAGNYIAEVSGRGFVNYGWPGDTVPGDVWRIRLWPDDGLELRPAVRWHQPGVGIPDDTTPPPTLESEISPPSESGGEEPRWIHVFGSNEPPYRLDQEENARRAAQRVRAVWGGDPIPQIDSFGGGQDLTRFDRDLVLAVLAAPPEQARAIAVFCAVAAADHAGLSSAPWLTPALDALTHDRPMPAPFDDISHIPDAFAQLTTHRQQSNSSATAITGSSSAIAFEQPVSQDDPYDRPAVPEYMAIPALYSACGPDPYRAAIETLHHASHTYAGRAADLHTRVKKHFFQQ